MDCLLALVLADLKTERGKTPVEALAQTPRGRSLLRRFVNVTYPYPIELVKGKATPYTEGSAGYFTTPSGKTIVHHPNAYGWRTVYHCSTFRIIVGRNWLGRK